MTFKLWPSHILLVASLASLVAGCGLTTPPHAYSLRSTNSTIGKTSAEDAGTIFLDSFNYNPAFEVIEAAAARVGCAEALRWLAYPKTGNMQQFIRTLYKSNDVYAALQSDLWSAPETRKRCDALKLQKPADDAGFMHLLQHVKSRGKKLTIIALGGFGSHLIDSHFLTLSEPRWHAAAEAAGLRDHINVLRFECSDSYQPDDVCAPEFHKFWTEFDAKVADSADQTYLLFGYSKGGSTLVQALSESQAMRDKTLAIMTVASPIAGAASVLLPNYLQDQLNPDSDKTGSELVLEALKRSGGLGNLGETEALIRRTLEAAQYQLPGLRQKYLANVLAKSNYYRSDRTRMPVFHLAGTLDLSRLSTSLPVVQRDSDANLKFELDHIKRENAIQTLTSPMFADYPIFDSTVALEHAVIPTEYLPDGADAELLALVQTDHLHFRQSNIRAAHDMPQVQLMDAILDVLTQRLERPKQGGK